MEPLEGGDISIEHFLQDQRDFSSSSNSLQRVFLDSCVLLTGATGALGSLVLEKILRSCRGVTRVFVTVRGQGNYTAEQRLKKLLSTKLFDRVRLQQGSVLDKVELLDLDLGLESHVATVTSSVTLVIHCALVTDSSYCLRAAVDANIRFTSELLQLAYRCRKLEAFVAASSTLCHHKERLVDERFYPPLVTAKAMCVICDTLSEDVLNNNKDGLFSTLLYRLLQSHSSASLITLSIAEDLLRQDRKSIPLAIVRPSMLIATYKEPLAGWMPQQPRGVMRLLTLAMQGRLCSLRSDASLQAELMPADLAASMLIAVTAHTASARRSWSNQEVLGVEDPSQIMLDYDIPIYNLVSSNQSPLSWREFLVCSIRHARSVPFLDTAWYPHLVLTTSKLWFSVWFCILHLLPAMLIDGYHQFTDNPNILNAKQSKVYQKYSSVKDSCESLTCHSMTSQKFQDHNTQTLWRSLAPSDRTSFDFNVSQLDWDQYLYTLARGVRLYCLGDSLDTIPRAVERIKKLKLLHYGSVVMSSFVIMLILRVFVKIILL